MSASGAAAWICWSSCSATRTQANPKNPNPRNPRRNRDQERERSDECECNPRRLWNADRARHVENAAPAAGPDRAHLGVSDRERQAPQMAGGGQDGVEGRRALRIGLAQRRTHRSARGASGRFRRRTPDAEPDHRARSAAQALLRMERQWRRFDRAGSKGQRGVADTDPSPPAQPLDHARRFHRLARSSRPAGRAGARRRAAAVLGRLCEAAERIRPAAAAGLMRGEPTTTIKVEQELAMKSHVVSARDWDAAREKLLVKEKEMTRARDALAAERRRMPWQAVEKAYAFEGPKGKASLLDLFDGRHQLIVYRAFFEPGVFGWPEQACRGCSMVADQVAHVAHLNARDTTLAFVSRAPQTDIARQKARMGWEMPWYSITDGFDKDFGVDEWHGTNVFFRDGDRVFRTYFINNRGDEAMGGTWSYLDITPLGRQEEWENSPEGYPQTPTYKWWNWHDSYVADAAPDEKWVEVSDAGEAAFRNQHASTKP